ncbi:MAG: nitrous oxide reductase accessory protein NosL [Gammaproteobacteria bacterium]|nr:nitrous oxide reductase accessory protein NosL [Gammaproteobacteria bacterium]
MHKIWLSLFFTLMLFGCSDPQTGTVEVHWDRDACDRCRMVVSDPHYAAQIRYFPPEKRSKVVYFDDIGCAVLWLEKQPWKDDDKTEIWVADHKTKQFINAKTAYYVPQNNTPMEYGLGAQAAAETNALSFTQAIQHVHKVEERFNVHGLQLQQAFEAANQTK